MGTIHRSSTARHVFSRAGHAVAFLPLLLAMACSGSIGDAAGLGAPPPGGVDPVTGLPPAPPPGPGGAPAPLPETAPVAGPVASRAGASSRFVRLNHRQWENTVRDLLKLPQPSNLSRQFVNEGVRTSFDTHGGELEISSQLWQDYNKAAGTLASQVARDAAKLNALIPANAPNDPEGKARAFIGAFGTRAFRRPLTDAEQTQFLDLYRKGTDLADGLELVITAFLSSPHVLYRTELSGTVANGKIALSDYEVASRLSYGLTNSMPDDQLFAAAQGKQLHTRDQVLSHAKRLLESPAGIATVRDIHDQMIKDVDPTELVRDAGRHPLFKPGIGADMKEEALAFVNEVIFGQGKSLSEMLTANWSMVNAKLAPLYGVQVPAGTNDKFVKVTLDGQQRAGIYTQLGFLAETGTDYNPRPIKRGVHLSEHLLCNKVPPPPPEANQTPIPNVPGGTNRQSFERATEAPGTVCAGCHGALINPLGFAFENYDGLGRFRNDENGVPINAASRYEFAEGTREFKGAVELMGIIAEGRQAHDCYAKQLFEYVYARSATPDDGALVTELGRRSKLDVPIKDIMLDLVATEAFLNRVP
jgi:hypothetical protein